MTRVVIYSAALVAFIACSALTLASIIVPRWISYDADTAIGDMYITYGLHRRCTGFPNTHCEPFPTSSDCSSSSSHFCSLWRTTGFLMSASMALSLVIIASYIFVISGGRERRSKGWKLLSSLLLLNGLLGCTAMAIISWMFDNDERFTLLRPGWKLDVSWICCTVSWSVTVVLAGVMSISGVSDAREGGYEAIGG